MNNYKHFNPKHVSKYMLIELYGRIMAELSKMNVPVIKTVMGDEDTDTAVHVGGKYDGLHLQVGNGYVSICAPTSKPLLEGGGLWFIDVNEHKTLEAAMDRAAELCGRDADPRA